MQFLCLAYGAEKDWLALTKDQQTEYLAQDEVLRKRGATMAAVQTSVTTVTAWDGAAKPRKPALRNPAYHWQAFLLSKRLT